MKKTLQPNIKMKFLKVSDICASLSVSDETVYRWIKNDGLPAKRIGKQWFISPNDFEDWMQSQQSSPKATKELKK